MILFDELEYKNGLNLFNGTPFSGIVFEKKINGGWDEVMMINGLETGISREWYPSGILRSEKHMENNYVHGVFWEWNEYGELTEESLYEFGIKVQSSKFGNNGERTEVFKIDSSDPNYENLMLYRKHRRSSFFNIPINRE
ncbi:MAG TPA: hypothetical protein VJ953_13900 [Saprospiraceae bacterium]|nr:hypothetical protein [Saprospiraceae bacterium]